VDKAVSAARIDLHFKGHPVISRPTDRSGMAVFSDLAGVTLPAKCKITVMCWTTPFRRAETIDAHGVQEFLVEVASERVPYTLRGRIVDATTRSPVPGARIIEPINGAKVVAGTHGEFDLFFVPWRDAEDLELWVWAPGYDVAHVVLDEGSRSQSNVIVKMYEAVAPNALEFVLLHDGHAVSRATLEITCREPGLRSQEDGPELRIERFLGRWESTDPSDTATRRPWGPFTVRASRTGTTRRVYLQSGDWRVTATAPGLVAERTLHLEHGDRREVRLALSMGLVRRVEFPNLPADAFPVEFVIRSSNHLDPREYGRGAIEQGDHTDIPGLPSKEVLMMTATTRSGWSIRRRLGAEQVDLVAPFPERVEVPGRITWRGRDYLGGGARLRITGLSSGWSTSVALVRSSWKGVLIPREACLFEVKAQGVRRRGARVPLERILTPPVRVELDYKTRVRDGLQYAGR